MQQDENTFKFTTEMSSFFFLHISILHEHVNNNQWTNDKRWPWRDSAENKRHERWWKKIGRQNSKRLRLLGRRGVLIVE